MKTPAISFNGKVKFVFPFLIIASSIFVSQLVLQHPELAIGITLDLCFIAPLVYWLVIRKTSIPKLTVVPFFIGGIVVASLILPKTSQKPLDWIITYVVPLVETTVLSVIVYKAYRISRTIRTHKASTTDYYQLLQESARTVLGKSRFTEVFVTEIALITYSLFIWKKPQQRSGQYTYYKESGSTAVFGVIIFLVFTETFIVHLLLQQWNPTVVWILTIGSCYGSLQLFAHLKALKRRYSTISDEHLYLTYGLFGNMEVEIAKIDRIELSSNTIENSNYKVEKLALLKDLEEHNVIIYFKERVPLHGAYGKIKTCDVLLLQIDNKQEFVAALTEKLHPTPTDLLNG